MFSWILARPGRNFSRQQIHDGAVLVGRPHGTVVAKKARSSTLFSAETIRSIEETWHKPLEADRHFAELAAELRDDPVNHAAAHQRLSHRNSLTPQRPVCEQVADGYREKMVRVHQAGNGCDNPVAVRVRIVGESHLVLVFQSHKPGHSIWTGTVHANFAVVVNRHE